jgi:site-specific DNA-adenine methylase
VLAKTLQEMDEIRARNLEKSIDDVFLYRDTLELRFMYSLIRLCCCGLYVGAFTSKKIYPQHTLPIQNMLQAFDRLQRTDWQVIRGSASMYTPQQGDFVFMDPPYLRTVGGYKVDKTFSLDNTYELIEKCQSANVPFLLTYGTGAQEDFPMLQGWRLLRMKTASKVNTTGKNVREENIYESWILRERT